MFLVNDPNVSTAAERYLLVYMIVVLVIVSALTIVIFIVFVKRKDKLLMEKLKQQKAFEEEISKTQLEIQEQTLKDIGRELHDNVGQLLSVASMQMSVLSMQMQGETKIPFNETKSIIKESLSEIRALSKSLNSDVIIMKGFKQSVQNEVIRLNKLNIIKAELFIKGDSSYYVESKDSIILFRILQEFISNTIKYAEASIVNIELDYQKDVLVMQLKDNGKGFNEDKIDYGAGLINMRNRAKLIHSDLKIKSKINEGVQLKMNYPYKKAIHGLSIK